MKSLSRVHLYTHKEPNGRGYIVAERSGLRTLAKALEKAASSAVGLEKVTVYSSDGHPYEIMVVTDLSENEWQDINVPYDRRSNPKLLESVQIYDSLHEELVKEKSTD
jgi:hypothetical protein